MARAAEYVFTMVNGVDLLLSAIKIIIMEDMEAMVMIHMVINCYNKYTIHA